MLRAAIRDVAVHLPEQRLTNEDIAPRYGGEWDAERFGDKTGILARRVASPGSTSSDLAYQAALTLFERGKCAPETFDFVLFCSEGPDYITPATAATLQHRLGIPQRSGALDINQACAGYIYATSVAASLVDAGVARNVLVFTGNVFSMLTDPNPAVQPLFGDAGSATWIGAVESDEPRIGPFVFGTDGGGAEHLIIRGGGFRNRDMKIALEMNGAEVAAFTLRVVPPMMNELLERARLTLADIDWFAFHQPNRLLLDQLCRKLRLPADRLFVEVEETANTGSTTIPIVLDAAYRRGELQPGQRVMLAGFGAGLSWGATLVTLV